MTQTVEPQLAEALDTAHIIYPNVELGEKALTLCGLEWKVNIRWHDIPADHLICRGCVDVAIAMLTDAVETATGVMQYAFFLADDAKKMGDLLTNEDSAFFGVVEAGNKYAIEQREKAEAKALRKAEKAEAKAAEKAKAKKKKAKKK